jgi:hypothetical protein
MPSKLVVMAPQTVSTLSMYQAALAFSRLDESSSCNVRLISPGDFCADGHQGRLQSSCHPVFGVASDFLCRPMTMALSWLSCYLTRLVELVIRELVDG